MERLQINNIKHVLEINNIKHTDAIIKDIKCKKELSGLDDNYVKQKIDDFFRHESSSQIKEKIIDKLAISKDYKQFCKSKEHDFLIKNIRSNLRKVYGVFIKENNNKKWFELDNYSKYVASDNKKAAEDSCKKILSMHQSSKERLNTYEHIYEVIFSEATGNDYYNKNNNECANKDNEHNKDNNEYANKNKYIILDLACGLNPLSSTYFKEKIKEYIAVELSAEDCNFIEKYFSITKIKGAALRKDLTDDKDIESLKNIMADICFMFKTLDSLEHIKKDVTLKLLKNIAAPIMVVSFPIVSIGGKKIIKEERRSWLENMLKKIDYRYTKFKTENELFYIIKK